MDDLLSWLATVVTTEGHEDLVDELLHRVKVIEMLEGEFLYHIGDVNGFYLLKQGAVSLLVPKVCKVKKHQVTSDSLILSKLRQSSLCELTAQVESCIDYLEIGTAFDEEVVVQLTPRCSLKPGHSCGNKFIESPVCLAESAQCTENSQLYFLSPEDSEAALKAAQRRRLVRLSKGLQQFKAFSGWTWSELYDLSVSCQEVSFKPGALVFQEGDAAEHVFIVRQGEFEFTKRMPSQILKVNSLGVKQVTVFKEKQVRTRQLFTYKGSSIFGEYDIIEKRNRLCTCRCLQPASVLKVSVRDFRVKMWVGSAVDYFTAKHRVETHNYRECLTYFQAAEQARAVSQGPIVERPDKELVSLKKQLSTLTSHKLTDLEVKDSLDRLLAKTPPKHHMKRARMSVALIGMRHMLKPMDTPIERHREVLPSLVSPQPKPPVNFFASPEVALKHKYNKTKKARRRKLVASSDNSFIIVRS
jgi:CRP-like cAMP-binding protein